MWPKSCFRLPGADLQSASKYLDRIWPNWYQFRERERRAAIQWIALTFPKFGDSCRCDGPDDYFTRWFRISDDGCLNWLPGCRRIRINEDGPPDLKSLTLYGPQFLEGRCIFSRCLEKRFAWTIRQIHDFFPADSVSHYSMRNPIDSKFSVRALNSLNGQSISTSVFPHDSHSKNRIASPPSSRATG